MIPNVNYAQARHDRSDELFRLLLDRTQSYSCAYFEREDISLEEAQQAKIDVALASLDLQPGMTLLDVTRGWGNTMRCAIEKYDVKPVGSPRTQWMDRPPQRCARGHWLLPGHMIVATILCSCGRHIC